MKEKKTTSNLGLELIKHFEGFYEDAYLCPAKVCTIGWGHTKTAKIGMKINKEEGERLLREDLQEAETAVNKLVTADLTQAQYDALVSFTFNLGSGNLKSSTLLRLLNEGKYQEAAMQFTRWNKAAGKVLKGLTLRREAEKHLFLTGANALK